jgi:hypothetical protein
MLCRKLKGDCRRDARLPRNSRVTRCTGYADIFSELHSTVVEWAGLDDLFLLTSTVTRTDQSHFLAWADPASCISQGNEDRIKLR